MNNSGLDCFLFFKEYRDAFEDIFLLETKRLYAAEGQRLMLERDVSRTLLRLVCIIHVSLTAMLVSRFRSICIMWLGVWKKRTIVF